MEPIACIKKRETISKILRAMGLSDDVPECAPARPPPQLRFEFVQDGEPNFNQVARVQRAGGPAG